MQWSVNDIVQATDGRLLYGPRHLQFGGVGIDSRVIEPRMLFVAVCGENHDGHTFSEQVVAKGVRGLVVQENSRVPMDHDAWKAQGVACVSVADTTQALGALAAYQRRRTRIPVVAITGSNGKTSTRQMTVQVMARKFKTLATQGNLNNEIGLPLTLFGLADDHQLAVLELGMNHAGEIDRLGAISKPTLGIITNVGPAHLEFLGSLEGVARAKGELLAHIDPKGSAILNKDDSFVVALADKAKCPVVFFGTGAGADIRAESIRESASGVAFDLILPQDRVPVQLKTPGRFMVSNALAAATAGHLVGISAAEIKAGLEDFIPVNGRLNLEETPLGVHIVNDTYNANPASMAAALDSLKAVRGSARGIVVLGDMLELGAQSEMLHDQVGRQVPTSGAVKLYAYGNFAPSVAKGALAAGMAAGDVLVGSKAEITEDMLQYLKPGDWILIKGSRGMAMETIVQTIRSWAADASEHAD